MSAPHPISIVGGGIAGLATAIALASSGVPCRVLERRAAFAEAGAGIQIGPNGVKALRALGVAEPLAALAGRPVEIAVRRGSTGVGLARLPLGDVIEARHGAPYWTLHRADLHAALLHRARSMAGISITFDFDACAISEEAGSVRLHDARGATLDGAAVVGADGLWSKVRRVVDPAAQIVFARRHAYRAVIAARDASPELSAATTTGLWLAPGVHVVHYPVRGSTEIAIVVVVTAREPCDGWTTVATSETVAAATASLAAPLRALIAAAPSWGVWSLYELPSRSPWSRGLSVLLGDAAHPMLPFLAQGAVMALEDSLSLAAAVAPAMRDGRPLQPALSAFEAQRRARVQRVIATARRNGTIYHLSGPAAVARDVVLRATPGRRLIAGYDWLYGHDPTTTTDHHDPTAPQTAR